LRRRRNRERSRRFLVEGPQAVREAIASGMVLELFLTERAVGRYPDLLELPAPRVCIVTDRAAELLSETTSPQGVVAVCAMPGRAAAEIVGGARLVAVLAGVSDPGNAGTVIRVADAAGADAVVFAGDTVDPFNGKCVRASTGSLFHLALGMDPDAGRVIEACHRAGLQVLAADAGGGRPLDEVADAGMLAAPTAWLFGNEAHGLDRRLRDAADHTVTVPMYGRAESLNLATAAAVCLYASARAHRRCRPVQADQLGSARN
jgi:TrmH family RNA methyltransferase